MIRALQRRILKHQKDLYLKGDLGCRVQGVGDFFGIMGFRVRGIVGDNGILGLEFQGSGLRKKLAGCRRPQECIDVTLRVQGPKQ